MTEAGNDAGRLSWESALPLFSATMQRQWAGAMLATAGLMGLILGVVFVVQGEWAVLLPMAGAVAACTAAILNNLRQRIMVCHDARIERRGNRPGASAANEHAGRRRIVRIHPVKR